MNIVFLGLTLSSSWGNGHATTYRGLLRALGRAGHQVTFLECNKPWYRDHRDLRDPDYCNLIFYDRPDDLTMYRPLLQQADAVVLGSYVPNGSEVATLLRDEVRGLLCCYDIDTPVTLAALDSGTCEYVRAEQIPWFDIYWSFTGGPTLDVLQDRWGAQHAEALYCAVDPEHYAPVDCPRQWDLGYLGTYTADRQPKVERLLLAPAARLPGQQFAVAGPGYSDTDRWPANVDRKQHLPPAEHAAFYCGQRYTLNVTRADMVRAGYAPSVRLFEAAACGTPIISDRWSGLDTLLEPGEEILIVDDTEDVVAVLEGLDERQRRRIGEAGRDRILGSHTADHRAREMVTAIETRATRAVA